MLIRIKSLTVMHYNGTVEAEVELFAQKGPIIDIQKRLIVNVPGRFNSMVDPELDIAIKSILTKYGYL